MNKKLLYTNTMQNKGNMNNKFFCLTQKKQQQIINAAYKVFSQNSYKKSPMSEIADECSISKSLLFYYFQNKKDLYMYLWRYSTEITAEAVKEFNVTNTNNFFEMLKRNLAAKCSLMEKYPFICAFVLQAFYEQEPEIKESIQLDFIKTDKLSTKVAFEIIDRTKFRSDINLQMMYKDILLASEGYLYQKFRMGNINTVEIENDFSALINFWEKLYLRN